MSAKRHPSLIPLSHDHHHGLVLAFRLREGLPPNRKPADNPQEQAEDAVRFFRDNLVAHFRAEEEALFPSIRTCVPTGGTNNVSPGCKGFRSDRIPRRSRSYKSTSCTSVFPRKCFTIRMDPPDVGPPAASSTLSGVERELTS